MDTETKSLAYELGNVEAGERSLTVDWGDGHQSRFHFLWLRDACECEQCGVPGFGNKYHAVIDFPEDIYPTATKIDADGSLIVEWSGEPHRSTYDGRWLREHCYSRRERERRRSKPVLWDSHHLPDLSPLPYETLVEDETTQFALLERLRVYGIVMVNEAPAVEGVAEVADCIGLSTQNQLRSDLQHQAGRGPAHICRSARRGATPHR